MRLDLSHFVLRHLTRQDIFVVRPQLVLLHILLLYQLLCHVLSLHLLLALLVVFHNLMILLGHVH